MPLFYTDVPGAIQTTNATPLTANDCFFVKAGAARTLWVNALYFQGRGASLSTVSGLTFRLEKWTATASSGGSAITPTPNDPGYQAAKHTAGWSATTVTSGTGGPTLCLSIGCSATGPAFWGRGDALTDQAYSLEAGTNDSLDIFCVSGAASMNFEMSAGTAE